MLGGSFLERSCKIIGLRSPVAEHGLPPVVACIRFTPLVESEVAPGGQVGCERLMLDEQAASLGE